MVLKLKHIILLSFPILFSCQNIQNIEGNYSICNKGKYFEIYFKKDSMRVASDDFWIKLSNWRKIKFQDDTLHFETFGEWRDSSKAVLKYYDFNKVKFKTLKSKDKLYLKPFDEHPNFENEQEFWKGFYNRKKSNNCDLSKSLSNN